MAIGIYTNREAIRRKFWAAYHILANADCQIRGQVMSDTLVDIMELLPTTEESIEVLESVSAHPDSHTKYAASLTCLYAAYESMWRAIETNPDLDEFINELDAIIAEAV